MVELPPTASVPDYVDIDGATLITEDVAGGVRLEKDKAVYAEEDGNGVKLLETLE